MKKTVKLAKHLTKEKRKKNGHDSKYPVES